MQRFSVLMSVYKNDDYGTFKIALDSILDQTIKPTQVVIMLDGPVSEDILHFLANNNNPLIEYYSLEKNVGLAKALNIGLSYCTEEIVARMDADDYSYPTRFEQTLPFLNDNLSLLGADYDIYDELLVNKIGTRKLPEESDVLKNFARTRTPFNHPTALLRKKDILSVGGYPDDIGRFEDWGLALRLLKSGYNIGNRAVTVLKFRGGEGMVSRRSGWSYAKEELVALKKMYSAGLIPFSILILNIFIRTPLRLLPVNLVKKLYSVLQPNKSSA